MATTIANGIVLPRYYHLWEDDIESKGTMEALGITSGIGPVIGFDIIDTTKNYLSITGINNPNVNTSAIAPKQELVKSERKYLKISDKQNQSGNVVNAHLTPDGLLSIDPALIEFESVAIDWTTINNGTACKVFVVTARHIYQEIPNIDSSILPTQADFKVFNVTNFFLESMLSKPLSVYLSGNTNLVNIAVSYLGLQFQANTDVVIGVYVLGNPSNYINHYPSVTSWYYQTYGRVFPLIPYNQEWPRVNSLENRWNEKVLSNMYNELPVSSKTFNECILYIGGFSLDPTDAALTIDNSHIVAEQSANIPEGILLSGAVSIDASYEIYPDISATRITGELSMPITTTGFTNLIEGSLRLDVESSQTAGIAPSSILPVLHKAVWTTTQVVGGIKYINFDILIKTGIYSVANKHPFLKISFISLNQ